MSTWTVITTRNGAYTHDTDRETFATLTEARARFAEIVATATEARTDGTHIDYVNIADDATGKLLRYEDSWSA